MGISLGRMPLTFVSRLSNGRPKVCKPKEGANGGKAVGPSRDSDSG